MLQLPGQSAGFAALAVASGIVRPVPIVVIGLAITAPTLIGKLADRRIGEPPLWQRPLRGLMRALPSGVHTAP